MDNPTRQPRHLAGLWPSIAFANLCCLNLWQDIYCLQEPFLNYYRSGPPGHALFGGTVLCILALGALCFLVRELALPLRRRFGRLFQALFLAACLLPVPALRDVVRSTRFSPQVVSVLQGCVYLYVAAVVFALMSHVILHSSRAYGAALAVNRLFWPLLPISLVFYIGSAMNSPATEFTSRQGFRTANYRPASRDARGRVVWIIFDEFAYPSGFAQRPNGLNLPELDRLRRESLFASNAYPPGRETMMCLPALINGRTYATSTIEGVSTLFLEEKGSRPRPWTAEQSIFSELRNGGARIAVVGWYHPYCRILGQMTDSCASVPFSESTMLVREANSIRLGTLRTAWYLFRDQLSRVTGMPSFGAPDILDLGRLEHLQAFRALHAQATRVVASPDYDIILLHYPVPHPLGIFDRRSRHLGVFAHSTYVDNLALVDGVVGELRKRLEVAGLWDTTNLVISTDHSLRDLWSESDVGPEGGKAQKDSRIPFIVKLANNTVGRDYSGRLNTVVTRQLITSIWSGRISTIDELDHWLRGRP